MVDERMTGETVLDEALKLIRDKGKEGEKLSVNTWIDLMSGESSFSSPLDRSLSSSSALILTHD